MPETLRLTGSVQPAWCGLSAELSIFKLFIHKIRIF